MAEDLRKKLMHLVTLANRPTTTNQEEARTAAATACKLLEAHEQELLALPAVDPWTAPARREGPAKVHPDAARLRDWRALMKRRELAEYDADDPGVCADCGQQIQPGDPVIGSGLEGLETHRACAGWWWTYESPNDIPF